MLYIITYANQKKFTKQHKKQCVFQLCWIGATNSIYSILWTHNYCLSQIYYFFLFDTTILVLWSCLEFLTWWLVYRNFCNKNACPTNYSILNNLIKAFSEKCIALVIEVFADLSRLVYTTELTWSILSANRCVSTTCFKLTRWFAVCMILTGPTRSKACNSLSITVKKQ